MMERQKFLEKIKDNLLGVEPDAEIILHGSRARGDYNDQSDWDFLILVDGPLDSRRVDMIRRRLYDIEWDTGEVISSIIRTRQEWGSSQYRVMPFYKNVNESGIQI